MRQANLDVLFLSIASRVRSAVERAGLSGGGVLAAVSGGLDSVCLLHLLHHVSAEAGLLVEVAHVDHGLREGSGEDAAFCGTLAGRLGLPFHLVRLDPARFGRGRGLQAEARRLRREGLEGVRARQGLGAVALGHHADDQAETVLYRLLRGAGPRGLGGMAEHAPPYLRPLLQVRRRVLECLAAERGWAFRSDPTNRDPRHARNRLRLRGLPVLREIHPGADAAVVRAARLLAEDDRYLTALARQAWARLAVAEPEGFRLPGRELLAVPAPLRRRLYLAAWEAVGCDPEALEARHLEDLDRLLAPGRPHRRAPVPGPGAFAVSYGEVWVLRSGAADPSPVHLRLRQGERVRAAPPDREARWERQPAPGVAAVAVPAGRGAGGVVLRSWRPGDRMNRPGRSPKKVKDLLMQARLPMWRRARGLVVEDADGILGVLAGGLAWGEAVEGEGWVWVEEGSVSRPENRCCSADPCDI